MAHAFLSLLLLLSLLLPGCSEASGFRGILGARRFRPISFVQEAHNSFQNSLTLPSATITLVTAANALVFINTHTCDLNTDTGWDPTPTDSTGQTWNILSRPGCLANATPYGANASVWYLFGANAGTHTLSQTYPSQTYGTWAIAEFIGPTAVDAVTSGSGESGAIAAVTTGSTQTTSATAVQNELVLVGLATNTGGGGLADTAFSNPPTNYQALAVQNDTVNFAGGQVSYRITTTVGTQAATWTWTNTGSAAEDIWRAVIGVLK